MVQKRKEKLKKETQGIKESTSKATFTSSHRRNAPLKVTKSREDQKVSGAISRNIEQIMTARVAHEGGHLRILKAPENVFDYAKGGARVSEKTYQQRSNQIGWRRTKLQDRQKELQIELNKEVRHQEKAKAKELMNQRKHEAEALKRKEVKRREKTDVKIIHEKLDDDDVAGNFFDDLIGDDFKPDVENLKPQDVGAKNSRGELLDDASTIKQTVQKTASSKKNLTTNLKGALLGENLSMNVRAKPTKRQGIKNLHDENAMKLLDDAF